MVGLYFKYTPIEWVNEDGGSLMALDITDLSHSEEMGLDASDVSVTTAASSFQTLSVTDLGFTSRPTYHYPCINDSVAYLGLCTSGLKVKGARSMCSRCTAEGRGGRGRTHVSNSLLASGTPITYTRYPCPNKEKYDCTGSVSSPRSVCSKCIAEGRPPPASKSKSIVQGLDVMEQYVEEHYQDANNDWILPDHE